LVDQNLGADMEHEGMLTLESVESADRQNREKQRCRDVSGLERLLVEKRQMRVVKVKVSREITIQCQSGGKLESVRKRTQRVGTLYPVNNVVAFHLISELRRLRESEGLAGAGRTTIVDRADRTRHGGVRREGIRGRVARHGKGVGQENVSDGAMAIDEGRHRASFRGGDKGVPGHLRQSGVA
jgi:hypothetical protein